jgi:hypothetical protein
MWSVEKPTFEAGETFKLCVSRIRDGALRKRLLNVQNNIAAAAVDYAQKAQARELNLIATSETVAGVVTKQGMVAVYDQRMAGKQGPGRLIYDQLRLLPKADRCPFCDQRNISTLDHILPKSLYPILAVTPLNLVAACMECNKAKLSKSPKTAAEVVMHPYFDDIATVQWLTARVVETTPCAVIFDVTRPESWNDLTEARARGQFALLGLGDLYAGEAARELANIRHNLKSHFEAGGANEVKGELVRQWHSRRARSVNAWQTAMYEAMASSDWFCGGGFA